MVEETFSKLKRKSLEFVLADCKTLTTWISYGEMACLLYVGKKKKLLIGVYSYLP